MKWKVARNFLILVTSCFLTQPGWAQDPFSADPFGTVPSDRQGDQQYLRGRPDYVHEVEITETLQQSTIDLGSLRPGQQCEIDVRLTNKSDVPLKFSKFDVKNSGVSILPNRLTIGVSETNTLRLFYSAPKSSGQRDTLVTVIDEKNKYALRLILSGHVHNVMQLQQTAFAIAGGGHQTIETDVLFDGIDPRQLRFRCKAREAAGWRLVPESESKGRLQMDLVLDPNEELSSTCELTALDVGGKIVGVASIELVRDYKPASRPNKLFLAPQGDKFFGRVVVQMRSLTNSGERSEHLTARGKSSTGKNVEIQLDANFRSGPRLQTLIECSVPRAQVEAIDMQDIEDLCVVIATEEESLEIPITILTQR